MVHNMFVALSKSGLTADESFVSLRSLNLFVAYYDAPAALPKTSFIESKLTDGRLDVSDALRGDVAFDNVKVKAHLATIGPFDYATFVSKYQGKRIIWYTDEDSTRYRVGRVWIANDNYFTHLREIHLEIETDPFKYKTSDTSVTVPTASSSFPTATFQIGNGSRAITQSGGQVYLTDTGSSNLHQSWGCFSIPVTSNKTYVLVFDEYMVATSSTPGYEIHVSKTLVGDSATSFSVIQSLLTPVSIDTSKPISTSGITKLYFYVLMNEARGGNQYGITNGVLVDTSSLSSVTNNGRKIVIPTISSPSASTLIGNGFSRSFDAGYSGLAWEFPLYSGANSVIAVTSGTAPTLTFREGYL